MLDSLMGRDRNVCGKEKRGDSSFKDEEVCKFYLLDYCPHELFPNTRSDLGPCPREHRSDLKEAFEKDSDHEYYKALYEQEFMRFLKKLVDQMESRIKRVQQRIDANNAATEVDKDTAEKIQTVNTQISELLKKQDEAGSKGEMEVAEKLNEEVALLQREVQRLKNPHADIATIRESQLRVCAVCGALQSAGDALCRYESHASGKQHRGFERIRASLAKLVETESTREAFLNKHPLHRGSSARDSYYGGTAANEGRRRPSNSSLSRTTGAVESDRKRKSLSGNCGAPHGRSGCGGISGGGYAREEGDRGKGDPGREVRHPPRGRSDDSRRYGGDGGVPDREELRQRRGYGEYDSRGGGGISAGKEGRVGGGYDGREDRGSRGGGGGRYGGHDEGPYYGGPEYRGNAGGRGTWEQQRRGGRGGAPVRRDYYRSDEYAGRGYGGNSGGGKRERESGRRSERLGGYEDYSEQRGRGGSEGGKYGGGGGYDERGDRRYCREGEFGGNRERYDEGKVKYYHADSNSGTGGSHGQAGRDDARWNEERRGKSVRRGRDGLEGAADDPGSRGERRNSREDNGGGARRRRERDEVERRGPSEESRSAKRRRGDAFGDDERRRNRDAADDANEDEGTGEHGYRGTSRRDHSYCNIEIGRRKEGENQHEEAREVMRQRSRERNENERGDSRQQGSNRRPEGDQEPSAEPAKNGSLSYTESPDRRNDSSREQEKGEEESSTFASGGEPESTRRSRGGHDSTAKGVKEARMTDYLQPTQSGDEAGGIVKAKDSGKSMQNVDQKPSQAKV